MELTFQNLIEFAAKTILLPSFMIRIFRQNNYSSQVHTTETRLPQHYSYYIIIRLITPLAVTRLQKGFSSGYSMVAAVALAAAAATVPTFIVGVTPFGVSYGGTGSVSSTHRMPSRRHIQWSAVPHRREATGTVQDALNPEPEKEVTLPRPPSLYYQS
jgi:hypothetical protein